MAIDWDGLRQSKAAAAESLQTLALSEVTPSRRDFRQFVGSGRAEVAVIGALRRGQLGPEADAAAFAASLDEAAVAAIAVATAPAFHGGRLDDLAAAAAASTAPVLRDEPLLHPLEIYQSRMCGADACTVAVGWVDDADLGEMVRVASSLHMTAVLGVTDATEVKRALAHDKAVVGVWMPAAIEVDLLRRLASLVPPRQTLILLEEAHDVDQWLTLRGLADAALAGTQLLGSDVAAVVEQLSAGQ